MGDKLRTSKDRIAGHSSGTFKIRWGGQMKNSPVDFAGVYTCQDGKAVRWLLVGNQSIRAEKR